MIFVNNHIRWSDWREEGLMGGWRKTFLAYCHGFIIQAPPSSNPRPALRDWHSHPAVAVGESVGPSGLPGPQLRLASIWPDRENTSQLKEQKQQRMDQGGLSNGDSNSDPNHTDWDIWVIYGRIKPTTELLRKATNLAASHLCIPTVIRRGAW